MISTLTEANNADLFAGLVSLQRKSAVFTFKKLKPEGF